MNPIGLGEYDRFSLNKEVATLDMLFIISDYDLSLCNQLTQQAVQWTRIAIIRFQQ